MRIALTRDPAQAGPLEAGLRAAGLQVQFLPLTEQRLPADTAELTTTLERLARGDFSWLLLTSGNTVRALHRMGWDGTVPEGVRIGVVGPGTARVLEELTQLSEPWMPTAEQSAAGIIEEMPVPAPGETPTVFLPQSAQARAELREGLTALGWEVTAVSAYETGFLVTEGRLEPENPRTGCCRPPTPPTSCTWTSSPPICAATGSPVWTPSCCWSPAPRPQTRSPTSASRNACGCWPSADPQPRR